MRVINVSLNELETKVLMIGFQGENEITQVRIDAAEILTDYPTATPTLIVKPLFGFAYPVIVAKEGTDVVWEIDNSVLSFHGDGEIQLTFTAGTVIAKSYVGRIRIKRSLAVNGETPDPIETWETAATAKLAEVDAQISELEGMVDAAEAAKDEAQDIVDDAAADIQAAGATQIAAVQAKGTEVLNSIPSDYTELSDDVTDLMSAINVLEPTATSGDVGRFLKAKSVENGKVTEYEFGSGSGSGTSDYTDLDNKPKINNVTLTGNKSLPDLGIQPDVSAGASQPTTLLWVDTGNDEDPITAENIPMSEDDNTTIAEAISDIGLSDYALIEDIEVETTTSVIVRNTTPGGVSYDFTEIVILIECDESHEINCNAWNAISTDNANRIAQIYYTKSNGQSLCFLHGGIIGYGYALNPALSVQANKFTANKGKIKQITIGGNLPAGMHILIAGR